MARVAARASTPAPVAARSPAKSGRKIEEDVLLTAVLCLVAFGAVMVYSASSATTVVKGGGDGTGLLIKYLVYGAAGFFALRVAARVPLQKVVALTGPLLAASFGLLVLVEVPGFGVSVNGATRWLGAGPLQFQPSEIAKLALVLYAARFLAERPRGLRRPKDLMPLGLVAGTSVLLVATQPDLGTALVICFTVGALMVVAGVPLRWLGGFAGVGVRARLALCDDRPVPHGPRSPRSSTRGITRAAPASRRCRARSRSARAASSATAWASRSRRSSTCPRRTPTSSSRSSARRSASSASAG